MTELRWSLLTGIFAHAHDNDDPLGIMPGSAHFHGSAPMAHRHLSPGQPAEVYDRLGTARWIMMREVRQILWELGLETARRPKV
jgi:hypothetical protein